MYEYNSEKNAFKVLLNSEMHHVFRIESNLKQINYLILALQKTRAKARFSIHTMLAMLALGRAWEIMAWKWKFAEESFKLLEQ